MHLNSNYYNILDPLFWRCYVKSSIRNSDPSLVSSKWIKWIFTIEKDIYIIFIYSKQTNLLESPCTSEPIFFLSLLSSQAFYFYPCKMQTNKKKEKEKAGGGEWGEEALKARRTELTYVDIFWNENLRHSSIKRLIFYNICCILFYLEYMLIVKHLENICNRQTKNYL